MTVESAAFPGHSVSMTVDMSDHDVDTEQSLNNI